MKSSFYYGGSYKEVAKKILDYINTSQISLSQQTIHSTRAAGDAIETLVAEKFDSFLGDWYSEHSNDCTRRAMADLTFTDGEGFYSIVGVKTHRKNTAFNIPNIASVERLSRFYESDNNIFSLILVNYAVENSHIQASEVIFCPIEFLVRDCLTIGAPGWGKFKLPTQTI